MHVKPSGVLTPRPMGSAHLPSSVPALWHWLAPLHTATCPMSTTASGDTPSAKALFLWMFPLEHLPHE